jgi:hypothetical protein
LPASLTREQCDQIGRIFAFWAIVYFGPLIKIISAAQIFGQLFSFVGYIFFTNSSGHRE